MSRQDGIIERGEMTVDEVMQTLQKKRTGPITTTAPSNTDLQYYDENGHDGSVAQSLDVQSMSVPAAGAERTNPWPYVALAAIALIAFGGSRG